jgi:hypothetical protein
MCSVLIYICWNNFPLRQIVSELGFRCQRKRVYALTQSVNYCCRSSSKTAILSIRFSGSFHYHCHLSDSRVFFSCGIAVKYISVIVCCIKTHITSNVRIRVHLHCHFTKIKTTNIIIRKTQVSNPLQKFQLLINRTTDVSDVDSASVSLLHMDVG